MFNDFNSRDSFTSSVTDYTTDSTCSLDIVVSKYDDREVSIPKIIMQTWKTHTVPKRWKTSPESIKKHMPDWKYVLMDDEENRAFVEKYYPDFLRTYDNFRYGIQRADAIRYMWLYKHGGIYMDLDYEIKRPLDELFTNNSEVYLVHSGNVGTYLTNSFMASKPGCSLWLKVLEKMKNPDIPWFYFGKHMEVMNSTGPVMLTHVVRESDIVYSMLPVKKVVPCSLCNVKCNADNSYLQQLEGSSWVSYDGMVYSYCFCNWRPLLLAIVLLIAVFLIFFFLDHYDWIDY